MERPDEYPSRTVFESEPESESKSEPESEPTRQRTLATSPCLRLTSNADLTARRMRTVCDSNSR